MYDPDTNQWTALPKFTRPRLLVRKLYKIQFIVLNYVIIARDEYFLGVLDGNLTAVDLCDFEVLEVDRWKRAKYSGEKRPYFNLISYALIPTSRTLTQ